MISKWEEINKIMDEKKERYRVLTLSMKIGDKYLCIKDRVEYVFCGCLYNGFMGCRGSEENPITEDRIKYLKPGESYYIRYNTKGNIYEVKEYKQINEGRNSIVRMNNDLYDNFNDVVPLDFDDYFEKINEFFLNEEEKIIIKKNG